MYIHIVHNKLHNIITNTLQHLYIINTVNSRNIIIFINIVMSGSINIEEILLPLRMSVKEQVRTFYLKKNL
jgi:hypothetical protein